MPMMLDSYLFFDGNCAEAMRFYEKVLGAKLQGIMKYGDGPPQGGDGAPQHDCGPIDPNRVMHASLLVGGRNLMASDSPNSQQHKPMQGFSLSLFYDTPEEARRIYDALSAGGQVTMPFAETFWAKGFGGFNDRFGTPWMVSGGAKMGPPA